MEGAPKLRLTPLAKGLNRLQVQVAKLDRHVNAAVQLQADAAFSSALRVIDVDRRVAVQLDNIAGADGADVHIGPDTRLELRGGVNLRRGLGNPTTPRRLPDSTDILDRIDFRLVTFNKRLFFDALGAEVETAVPFRDPELELRGEVTHRLLVDQNSLLIALRARTLEHAIGNRPLPSANDFPAVQGPAIEDAGVGGNAKEEGKHGSILTDFGLA